MTNMDRAEVLASVGEAMMMTSQFCIEEADSMKGFFAAGRSVPYLVMARGFFRAAVILKDRAREELNS